MTGSGHRILSLCNHPARRERPIRPAGGALTLHSHPALTDCVFLVLVVVLSAALYVGRLGFHGDDWGYFAELSEARNQSLPRLIATGYERDLGLHQRPVQLAYVATSYWAFGLNPLGYHVVGAAMLVLIALLLYGILRELDQPRVLALAVPLVYTLLPNYSGARLWFGAHAAIVSVLFLAISAYAALRAIRASRFFAGWLGLGAAAVVASGLAYEVTLPVVGLVVVGGVIHGSRGAGLKSAIRSRRVIVFVAAYGIALAAALAFKAYITTRVGIDGTYLDYLARIARGSVQVNFGAYGIGIPYVVSWISLHAFNGAVFALSGVVGAGVAFYLALIAPVARAQLQAALVRYLIAGLGIFVAGCTIFVIPTLVHFESTGRDNRIGVAATLGVAAVYVGLLAGAASLFSRPAWRRVAFASLAGVLCAAAFLITNTQAQFWIDAYEKQEQIRERIANDVNPLPREGALILDGVCLQKGGAWVLTGARDLPGLLRLRQGAAGIRGAAISRPVRVDSKGIYVKAFNAVTFFPYDEELVIYNYRRRATYRLTGQADADAYFASRQFRPERRCPTVFAWGLEGRL